VAEISRNGTRHNEHWICHRSRAGVKFAALSGFDRARLHEWVVQNQIN
jgi:hypothetical protein